MKLHTPTLRTRSVWVTGFIVVQAVDTPRRAVIGINLCLPASATRFSKRFWLFPLQRSVFALRSRFRSVFSKFSHAKQFTPPYFDQFLWNRFDRPLRNWLKNFWTSPTCSAIKPRPSEVGERSALWLSSELQPQTITDTSTKPAHRSSKAKINTEIGTLFYKSK